MDKQRRGKRLVSNELVRTGDAPPPLVLAGEPGQRLSGREILDTLFRQKWMILLLWSIVFGVTAAYIVFTPPEYETEMTILVKDKRVDLGNAPDGSSRPDAGASDTQLATEIQLLSSRELFRGVVLEAGLAKSSSEADVSMAVNRLKKQVRISPVLKSALIQVRYSDSDPRRCARVLEVLAANYLSRQLELHSSPGSFEFFNNQVGEYEKKLRAAHDRLLAFQSRTKIVLLSEQRDLTLRKLLELEASLRESQALRSETELRAVKLREQMSTMGGRITTQVRKIPNQYSAERLNTLLAELQNRRTELLTKFRADDRMVKQLDQQIADTRKTLEITAGTNSTEEATDVNPVRQAIEGELGRADVSLTGLSARISSVSRQIAGLRTELSNLETAAPDDQVLLREVTEAEQNFILYSKKREEARIAQEMDRQKIANVALVDPPRIPAFPKSKVGSGAPAAFLLAIVLIVALSFALGHRRNVVHTPWELESTTGLQVLATIPLSDRPYVTSPLVGRERSPVLELEGQVQE